MYEADVHDAQVTIRPRRSSGSTIDRHIDVGSVRGTGRTGAI